MERNVPFTSASWSTLSNHSRVPGLSFYLFNNSGGSVPPKPYLHGHFIPREPFLPEVRRCVDQLSSGHRVRRAASHLSPKTNGFQTGAENDAMPSPLPHPQPRFPRLHFIKPVPKYRFLYRRGLSLLYSHVFNSKERKPKNCVAKTLVSSQNSVTLVLAEPVSRQSPKRLVDVKHRGEV